MDIEKAARITRKLKAHDKARIKAWGAVVDSFAERWRKKRDAILDGLDAETRELIDAQFSGSEPKSHTDAGIIRDDETEAIDDSAPESLPRGALPYVAGEAAKAAARGKR
jgi:hypothetical protein